eukprot:7614954-Heterocapsa_arctica.AAC.1
MLGARALPGHALAHDPGHVSCGRTGQVRLRARPRREWMGRLEESRRGVRTARRSTIRGYAPGGDETQVDRAARHLRQRASRVGAVASTL